MVFDAAGNLIKIDDGGIYKRTSPADGTGDWSFIGGTLQNTEFAALLFDPVSSILFGGSQDNGSLDQSATNNMTWSDQVFCTGAFGLCSSPHGFIQGDGQQVPLDTSSSVFVSIR